MPKAKRKTIAFDLSTNKLAECGFKVDSLNINDKLKPYNLIKKALKELGFEHQQKSIYVSVEPMTRAEVLQAIKQLDRQLPWLSQCVDKLASYDVPAHHDYTATLTEATAERIAQERYEQIRLPELEPSQDDGFVVNIDDVDIEWDESESDEYDSPEHEHDDSWDIDDEDIEY